ncbi:helix-turn-helix domain-containing protein [Streptomyces sp. NPDC048507]|uniref:helix-turn-helix domain-containing protein n=1 Tax=Streptomyces sp. NPDC048507 TaxID=3365560 RepID=UPI0037230FAC
MTEALSVPPAVLDRIADLGARLGRGRQEVLDPRALSLASGVPLDVVRELLRGRPAGEPDIHRRFRQRLDLLHDAHRKDNGRKYSHGEIAAQSGISRQQVQALLGGDRRPTMDHCSRLEKFFRRPAGFLQSEDADALAGALAEVEQALLREWTARDAAASLYARHGVDGIALRAALLSEGDRTRLLQWLDAYMTERSAGESPARAPDMAAGPR